jgi:hypothetical protein
MDIVSGRGRCPDGCICADFGQCYVLGMVAGAEVGAPGCARMSREGVLEALPITLSAARRTHLQTTLCPVSFRQPDRDGRAFTAPGPNAVESAAILKAVAITADEIQKYRRASHPSCAAIPF